MPDGFANSAQKSLSIEERRLFQVVWFELEGRNRILFASHHLITDGVSWRIFLEDFSTALEQLGEGRAIELAPVTDSALIWAEQLASKAEYGEFDSDRDYWAQGENSEQSPLDAGIEGEGRTLAGELSGAATEWLLHESSAYLRTHINDWLLAALAEAWCETTSESSLVVHLEGHGRDDFGGSIDLSRTMGWFTALYPVRLKASPSLEPADLLRQTKETLRSVPNQGVSYGALQIASSETAITPRISFNYLGQLDRAISEDGLLSPAADSIGHDRCPEAPRQHELDLVLRVQDGRLAVECLYAKGRRGSALAPDLLRAFIEKLEKLVAHFKHLPVGGATSSDFPLVHFGVGDLARVIRVVPQADTILPLSPLQEGLYIHSQIQQRGGEYLQQISAKLHGDIEEGALVEAWEVLIDRHELLRSSIVSENLEWPVLVVHQKASANFDWLDWRGVDSLGQELQWQELLFSDRRAGIDIGSAPMMRFTFVRVSDDAYRLLWTHHHLILDGWSLPVLVREFLEIFEDPSRRLPPVRPWREHIDWLSRQNTEDALAFWKQYLAGFDTPTEIERDSPSAGTPVMAKKETLVLPTDFASQITAFCKEERYTLNTLVQGAWGVLLGMHNDRTDVLFGVTVSGRSSELEAVEERVGLFINTLPLRVDTSPGQSVGDYLAGVQVQQGRISQFEYSRIAEIRAQSELPGSRPLFETLLVFENYPLEKTGSSDGAKIEFSDLESLEQNHFPLSIYVTPGDELQFEFAYRSGEFSERRIHQLMNDFLELITAMVADPGRSLGGIDCFRPARRSKINGLKAGSSHMSLPEQFAQAAAVSPGKVAVSDGRETLTFKELDEYSSRLAATLVEGGKGAGAQIGVHLPRNSKLLIVLIGIAKAGATYVPLDPDFPPKRLAMMIEDSDLACIISARGISDSLPISGNFDLRLLEDLETGFTDCQAAVPDWEPPGSEDLAYILFTSGSTGRPKGVEIPHRALGNFLNSWRQVPGMTSDDSLLAVTTLSFDISALELFLPIVTGAKVHIASAEDAHDPDRLMKLLEHTTVMQATPATWKLLTMSGWSPPQSLRIWCGGEAFPRDLAELLLANRGEIWNVYGPTETTIWSLIHRVTKPDDVRFIGRVIDQTSAYVVDQSLRLVPIGCVGELLIGGDGLARGYVGQPAQTADRFVPDTFAGTPGGRLYRTGDLVRQHKSGVFEFLGRVDQQVKVRGFRVELAEIEEVLRALDIVQDAAVRRVTSASGEALLAAYLVPSGNEVISDQIVRDRLGDHLPFYMIPSQFVTLDLLPLTPNGKIDRKALPDIDAGQTSSREKVSPTTALEKTIARIWQTVLKVDEVGIDDQFFELGGHSLSIAQAAVRLRRIFKIDLSLEQLFSAYTVRLLSQLVESKLPDKAERIASIFLKVDGMSAEEKAALIQMRRRQNELGSAGGEPHPNDG